MGTRRSNLLAAAVVAGIAGGLAGCDRVRPAAPPAVAEPPLIARADLFGDPARQQAQLAPGGDRVAFLAPRDGVINLWVVSVSAMDDPVPVTDERARGVHAFWWAQDGATLLYASASATGDDRLFAVSADGGEARALTPENVHAEIVGRGAGDPAGVVVALYQRDPTWPDLYRIDLASGLRTLVYRNAVDGEGKAFTNFLLDHSNQLRIGMRPRTDGGAEIALRVEQAWRPLFAIPFSDVQASRLIAVEAGGQSFLMIDSTDRDRAALVRVDVESGAKTVLGESQSADVVDAWIDPVSQAPEAFVREYLRADWRALEAEAQADLDFFAERLSGDARVTSRSADDGRWIVEESAPTLAPRSYLYDRRDPQSRRLTPMFRHYSALETAPLQSMTPVEIAARDGLTLVSYLTLPVGADANGDARPDAPAPLVIAPRAEPWGRNGFGFDPLHQWLANRGYAVLSVNMRGSSGFGTAFLNAGNLEWGARMQEDLLDAMQWAVDNGVAQSDRIAIFGSGYGGYAALAGLAFAPDRFRCGVSFGAPANLAAMLEALPSRERAYLERYYLRVGDPRNAGGLQMLRARSPSEAAAQINRPLLIGVGGRDPGVSRAALDAIALNLRERRQSVMYINFPDEGAQLTRAEDRLAFYAIAEDFLGRCLGGRVEPVGAAFEGANLEALEGASEAPGLSAFARRLPAASVSPPTPPDDDDETAVRIAPLYAPPAELSVKPPAGNGAVD